MATPITWRNVEARSNSDALTLLDRAGNQMTRGLGSMEDVLRGVQLGRQKQWETGVDTNTQAYQDYLARFSSPEALAAAQASGELDAFRAQFGTQIDPTVARSASRDMLRTLRTDRTAAQTDEDLQESRRERPLEEAIRLAIASDNDTGFQSLMAENPGLRNAATLMTEYTAAERGRKVEGREDHRWGRGLTLEGREDAAHKREMDAQALEDLFTRTVNDAMTAQASDGNALTNTQIQQGVFARLREANAPVHMFAQAAEALNGEQARLNGIADEDQRLVNQQIAQLEENLGWARNPYQEIEAPGYSPTKAAADVMESFMDQENIQDAFRDNGTRQKTVGMVVEALTKGVNIDGERIPVTPSMVRTALMETQDTRWLFDERSFESAIQDSLTKYGGAEQYLNYQEVKKGRQTFLDGAKAKYGGKNPGEASLRESLQPPSPQASPTPPPAPVPARSSNTSRAPVSTAPLVDYRDRPGYVDPFPRPVWDGALDRVRDASAQRADLYRPGSANLREADLRNILKPYLNRGAQ